MNNIKFITDILNIDFTLIDSVHSANLPDDTVLFFITLKKEADPRCPYCNGRLIQNGFYSKKLVHSTLVNRKCTIIYKRRRYICHSCDISLSERNPFSLPRQSVTHETKINILKLLKRASMTYTYAAELNHISVTQVIRIFDRHVSIPRKPLPEVLSIDEHYFPQSNFDSLYMCIFMDFNTGTIIDVLPDRKKEYISNYLSTIANQTLDYRTQRSELANVKYVSIDLYDTYRELAQTFFPRAIVCADSFHVLENLTKAFRKVRVNCRKSTEDDNLVYLFTKFKYVFNHGVDLDNEPQYNKRFGRFLNQRDILNLMLDRFPKLKLAYELKEAYIQFNSYSNHDNVKEELTSLIERFEKSEIDEYKEFTGTLVNWYEEIINSFSIVNNRRINNSYIESRNRQIESLLYNANGFTNFKRLRNRILYCLNKKDGYKL